MLALCCCRDNSILFHNYLNMLCSLKILWLNNGRLKSNRKYIHNHNMVGFHLQLKLHDYKHKTTEGIGSKVTNPFVSLWKSLNPTCISECKFRWACIWINIGDHNCVRITNKWIEKHLYQLLPWQAGRCDCVEHINGKRWCKNHWLYLALAILVWIPPWSLYMDTSHTVVALERPIIRSKHAHI